MTDATPIDPIPVGLDDGYAYTKIALPDGRLVVIPSRARVGHAASPGSTRLEQRIFEYETEGDGLFGGAVDGAAHPL